jgi:hypothetical protein
MRGVGSNTQVSELGGLSMYIYSVQVIGVAMQALLNKYLLATTKGTLKVLCLLLQVPVPGTHSISTEPTAWAGVPMKRPDMMR